MSKELENNQTISHYRIVKQIGKGGMGEVFLAEDTKLERRVAVKFLNDEFSRDADKVSRFIREAKAASALNHPNILTVYEIGAEGGTNYIAAEFIDGKALTAHIAEDKISLESVLDVSIQIVSALQTAHSAGIVHRDMKPDNVMIRRDGIVKVLDFGLAKLTEKPIAEDLNLEAATIAKLDTVPGVVMGTPNYMSPEQARGKDIDRQTDIFSFGVVLYEMLTRKLPFAGETVSDIIASILTKQPRPIEEFNESVPGDLRAIVEKTLEKDKSNRYRNADELLEDLKNLKKRIESGEELERTILPQTDNQETQILKAATTGRDARTTNKNSRVSVSLEKSSLNKILAAVAGVLLLAAIGLGYWFYSQSNAKQIESIAVLPFVNESGNADVEYLSDGMTETLIKSLANLSNLNVKPRSSVFRYKGKDTDLQTIAKELNVQAILNGRIVQRGDQITLSLELVDISKDKLIWTESYNRKQSDLVALQSEIAKDVSTNLKAKLSGADEQKVVKTGTTDTEAYQAYLKGRYYWNKRTEENLNKAIEQFKAAADKDPNYALAYAGLADCYNVLPYWSNAPSSEFLPQGKAYATRAIAIDASLGEAHISLALADRQLLNWAAAEKGFKRGLELNPNYATGRQWYAEYLYIQGRYDESLTEMKRAQELEPLSLIINVNVALVYLAKGDAEAAVAQCKRAMELDPDWYYAHESLAFIYIKRGRNAEALAEAEKAVELSNRLSESLGALGYVLAQTGKRSEALQIAEELKARFTKRQAKGTDIGWVYLGLNEKDEAVSWLEKDFKNREAAMTENLALYPLNSLRDDARLKDLLKRMNLPE